MNNFVSYLAGSNTAQAASKTEIERSWREIKALKTQVEQLQKIRDELNGKLQHAQAQAVGVNALHCALAKALKEVNPDHPLCKPLSEKGSARFTLYHETANSEFDKYVPR